MPSEPRCSICQDPASRTAVAELVAKDIPLNQIAARLKIPRTNVQRHAAHEGLKTKKPGRPTLSVRAGKSVQAGRRKQADGRCQACGILAESPDPQGMMRRAERALHVGEEIVLRSQANDDDRTALMGLDRVHRSLELCMKAVGLIGSDVTVNVQQTETLTLKRAFGLVCAAIEGGEKRQAEFARICGAFFAGEPYELPVTIDANENGTQIRDSKALNP